MTPCGSHQHQLERRSFLQGITAGTLSLCGNIGFLQDAMADGLKQGNKRILMVEMHGGLSQLESWDPKPGTKTGGPFRAIPTSVPGIHIGELLPETAKQMHHLSVIRGVNTSENDHKKGRYLLQTGHKQSFAVIHPELGAVVAHELGRSDSPLPANFRVLPSGGGNRNKDAGFLGPAYASTAVSGDRVPNWTARLKQISEEADLRRRSIRAELDNRFAKRRRNAATAAYAQTFQKSLQLMNQRDAFDLEREPEADHARYGPSEFGRQCLLARRLLEHDVPFVRVSHSNYDTHNDNFNFHIELLGEFDRPFATLVADLADRGLLEHTLVLVVSEFGRTPRINARIGRDHWGKSWSVVVGGAGVQRGALIGKTSPDGTEVVDRQVDHRHLHHTFLSAVGIDSSATFEVGGQSVPIADPSGEPIEELLA